MQFGCCSVRLSYRSLLEKYNLSDLSSRCFQLDAMMLFDLCDNKYDCAALIVMLYYRVHYQAQQREARLHHLFAINRSRTVAGARSLMRLLVDTNNKRFNAINIITSAVG
ncbi:hypothetical protein EVAR_28667_1 [Eumeta japonica]|uniref:Uncharacterized protein n=1 Tax=Eumeta variegata TaxID=151549 RepID=A0A4C1V5F9_EUMVA|nr:hypothetical protein EVAR_28667_1 [Eumeta japonica]